MTTWLKVAAGVVYAALLACILFFTWFKGYQHGVAEQQSKIDAANQTIHNLTESLNQANAIADAAKKEAADQARRADEALADADQAHKAAQQDAQAWADKFKKATADKQCSAVLQETLCNSVMDY